MWNGRLAIGKLEIAVKLYAAIEDAAVHFHLLHARDRERVKQHMVNPVTGEVKDREAIQKGYEIRRGTYVLLSEEELAELEPPASKEMKVEAFLPFDAIEPVWYERPYHLGPAAKSPEYFALVRALEEQQRLGLVRWTMRKQVHRGALRACGDHLTLSTLHSASEVAAAPKLSSIAAPSRGSEARELAMAEQLVEALAGDFDPSAFKDEHRERVLAMIAAKARGKRVELPRRARKPAAKPLGLALEQSLKQLGKASVKRERLSA